MNVRFDLRISPTEEISRYKGRRVETVSARADDIYTGVYYFDVHVLDGTPPRVDRGDASQVYRKLPVGAAKTGCFALPNHDFTKAEISDKRV